jgi:site-specific recombinase XerD
MSDNRWPPGTDDPRDDGGELPRLSDQNGADKRAVSELGGELAGFLQDPELKEDFRGAYSLNTMRAYRADWADWCAWCARHGKRPLPAEPRAIRDYLVDLAAGKKLSTIQRRLSAIARAHKLAGVQLDKLDPTIWHALRRLRRQATHAPQGRAELMTGDLVAILKVIPQDLRGLRDRAILLLGFAGGLRRSEIVAFEVNDLEWRRDGIKLRIRRSKGDQEGEGQEVGILYGKKESTCPCRALKRWLEASQICDGPVFRAVVGDQVGERRLSDKIVWKLVKRYAARAGLDPSKLGAHSLRVGHVTQARANGADLAHAKRQLRHKRIETTEGYDRNRSLRDSTSGKLGL